MKGRVQKRVKSKISPFLEIQPGRLRIDLPIQTKSEANCCEPWQTKHRRHKHQANLVFKALMPVRDEISLPCKIKLTRLAPKELDRFDNLPMSFKYIVDAICSILTGNYTAGKADSDPRISIECDQIKSKEYGIRIEIMF